MPYHWSPALDHIPKEDAPLVLSLTPHRSLPARGFGWVIWTACGLALIPLLPFVGSVAFWVILPLMMAVIGGLWIAIRASDRDHLREEVEIRPTRIDMLRTNANRSQNIWCANPYWVRLTLHRGMKPVESYLTMKGEAREIEIGAFLSPDERRRLRDDLAYVLGRIKTAP